MELKNLAYNEGHDLIIKGACHAKKVDPLRRRRREFRNEAGSATSGCGILSAGACYRGGNLTQDVSLLREALTASTSAPLTAIGQSPGSVP